MIVCPKCKHENYIPGTRYCTKCGVKLKKQNKSIPQNDQLERFISVPFDFNSQTISDNLFYGYEVNNCPLFVSHSGKWLWYVRGQSYPMEIEDAPENSRNRVIGIIHNDKTSPFVLIALRKLVFVYNSFTNSYMNVWVSTSDDQECTRMPVMIKIHEHSKTDYQYRILLILNNKNDDLKKNKLVLKTYDLVREKRFTTNDPYEWCITEEKIIREFPLHGIKLILDPIYYEQHYYIFMIARFTQKKLNKQMLSGKLCQLNENFKFAKNIDVKLSEKKLKSTIAFYQLNYNNNKIIFWADVDNNPQLWSLSLTEMRVSSYMSDNEKNTIDKTSPLCSVLCDGRYCLTFSDHEDRLYVKSSHRSTIPQTVAQLPLENAFIPVSYGNTIFAVDNTKRNIIKYTFEKQSLNEKEIVDKSVEKLSTICSNPVHANDRIFFLRGLHSSGKNSLRLECVS